MMRNRLFTSATILGAAFFFHATVAKAAAPPNVLVILLDDAGYKDFSYMGSKEIKTPHIDKLAESGVVFSDAHTSGTSCSPSRAGFMTGRYQQRFGHEENSPPRGKGMDPSEKTIGDAFQAIDYRTIYIGKWHLGSTDEYYPTNRGWDEFYGLREGHRGYFPSEKYDKPGKHTAIEHNGKHVKWDGYVTDLFTDAALKYLDASKDKPFFMFLSYTAPHTPLHAKKEHLEMFKGKPRQKFAAMMWSVDEGIGRVLAKLEELKLRENTLVFFLSDNGGTPHSDNSPLKGHKGYKFEGGQRVPFIVSWPAKLEGGSNYDGLTSGLDIFATSAAVTGAPTDLGEPLDGVNLIPHLTGANQEEPHDILYWHRGLENAVRMGDYKLIGHDHHGWFLYDLEDDVGETTDLSKSQPQLVEEMIGKLESWKSDLAEPQWKGSERWRKIKSRDYDKMLNQTR